MCCSIKLHDLKEIQLTISIEFRESSGYRSIFLCFRSSFYSHVKITQYWFLFPIMINKFKKETYSLNNKINLHKILFSIGIIKKILLKRIPERKKEVFLSSEQRVIAASLCRERHVIWVRAIGERAGCNPEEFRDEFNIWHQYQLKSARIQNLNTNPLTQYLSTAEAAADEGLLSREKLYSYTFLRASAYGPASAEYSRPTASGVIAESHFRWTTNGQIIKAVVV